METTILILCAGEAIRWYGDCLKQLVPIAGEPLLERTLRQLRKLGHEGIIVSHLPELHRYGHSLDPVAHHWASETLLGTRELWADRTVILLGDVVWPLPVLSYVVGCSTSPAVFGNYQEIYAVSFSCKHWEQAEAALRRVIVGAEKGKNEGKLWSFYHALAGFDRLDIKQWNYSMFQVIASDGTPAGEGPEGYTRDFDRVEDYERFLEGHLWAKS